MLLALAWALVVVAWRVRIRVPPSLRVHRLATKSITARVAPRPVRSRAATPSQRHRPTWEPPSSRPVVQTTPLYRRPPRPAAPRRSDREPPAGSPPRTRSTRPDPPARPARNRSEDPARRPDAPSGAVRGDRHEDPARRPDAPERPARGTGTRTRRAQGRPLERGPRSAARLRMRRPAGLVAPSLSGARRRRPGPEPVPGPGPDGVSASAGWRLLPR